MKYMTTGALRDLLLEGEGFTVDDLDELIQSAPPEDVCLDYKDGKLTNDRDGFRRTVREYVSGFANAEGGVLVVGISEQPWGVSGCRQIGAEPLDVWAQKVLSDMASFLSPQPRFRVVAHPQGSVLLIAVARAPQLVPCVEAREVKYFYRFHDSTRELPMTLVSDLLLGRRQEPALDVRIDKVECKTQRDPGVIRTVLFEFSLTVENSSFVTADDLEVGIVGWTDWDREVVAPGNHLRAYVDLEYPVAPALNWKLKHQRSKADAGGRSGRALAPFDSLPFSFSYFQIPWHVILNPTIVRSQPPMLYSCGLYVLTAGALPAWYQLEATMADGVISWRTFEGTLPDSYLSLRRLHGSRPLVAWREKADR